MGVLERILGAVDTPDYDRLFFVTDLHGSNKCFKKVLNVPEMYDVDTLVIGGDLSGKSLVPVIEEDGSWSVMSGQKEQSFSDESRLEERLEKVRESGNYPYRTTPAEIERLEDDDDRVDELYREKRLERLSQWEQWAEDKLGDSDTDVYIIAGNDDHEYVVDALRSWDVFDFVDDQVIQLPDGRELIGYSWSNPTPWNTPREKTEDDIRNDLRRLSDDVDDWSTAILNFHCPPYQTEIDNAPQLDEDLNPKTAGGEVLTEPVGSRTIRDWILEHEPMLGLHGHIHESQGNYSLGETLCLNPGSDYSNGYLQGALVMLDDESVVNHQFVSG